MKNDNKGFSLIELIVVIAIMAILVGVLAPNVLKYVESSRESADKQVADTVRTAVMTALVDPAVNDGPTLPLAKTAIDAAPFIKADSNPTKFSSIFVENLGMSGSAAKAALKSKKFNTGEISVVITASNEVEVLIDSSDGNHQFSTKNGDVK